MSTLLLNFPFRFFIPLFPTVLMSEAGRWVYLKLDYIVAYLVIFMTAISIRHEVDKVERRNEAYRQYVDWREREGDMAREAESEENESF